MSYSRSTLELKKFDEDLSKKTQYIIFNKVDLLSDKALIVLERRDI